MPRVVSQADAATITDAATRIVTASLAWALDAHAAGRAVSGYPLDWVRGAIATLPEPWAAVDVLVNNAGLALGLAVVVRHRPDQSVVAAQRLLRYRQGGNEAPLTLPAP